VLHDAQSIWIFFYLYHGGNSWTDYHRCDLIGTIGVDNLVLIYRQFSQVTSSPCLYCPLLYKIVIIYIHMLDSINPSLQCRIIILVY